jgi:hypothetical protein
MLFGHQNDQNNDVIKPAVAPVPGPNVNPLAVDPVTGASLPAVQMPTPEPTLSSVLNQPTVETPAEPVVETPVESVTPFSAPLVEETPVEPEVTPPSPSLDRASIPQATPAPTNDALLALKQRALTELSPLVDQLEQSPEERFRTTMMMIQSTDNQALIQTAYDAAQAITDEKVRAQALLDVINEINYFTQQSASNS